MLDRAASSVNKKSIAFHCITGGIKGGRLLTTAGRKFLLESEDYGWRSTEPTRVIVKPSLQKDGS